MVGNSAIQTDSWLTNIHQIHVNRKKPGNGYGNECDASLSHEVEEVQGIIMVLVNVKHHDHSVK